MKANLVLGLSFGLAVFTLFSSTPALAKNALVIRVEINSSVDDSLPKSFGVYEQTKSFNNVTMSARGSGKFVRVAKAIPQQTAEISGSSEVTHQTAVTKISEISETSVLLAAHVVSTSPAASAQDYSGEARIVEGSWSDYRAGKTIRLVASETLMRSLLTTAATSLGNQIVDGFSPVLNANGLGMSLSEIKTKSSKPQVCVASLRSLHCELFGAVAEAELVAYRR